MTAGDRRGALLPSRLAPIVTWRANTGVRIGGTVPGHLLSRLARPHALRVAQRRCFPRAKGPHDTVVTAAPGSREGSSAVAVERPGRRDREVALARVLSTEGRWIVLHGASLVADGRGASR
jgi:hypothetical protein